MADVAAHFEEPRQRPIRYLATGLRHLAARAGRLRDRLELADARNDLDARRQADTGITASRGFERVSFMLRGGLR